MMQHIVFVTLCEEEIIKLFTLHALEQECIDVFTFTHILP